MKPDNAAVNALLKEMKVMDLLYSKVCNSPYGPDYTITEVYTGPLGTAGIIDHLIAEKVAEKYGLKLETKDFNDREDEPSDYRTVLLASSKITDIEQLKEAIKVVVDARNDFKSRMNKLVDYVFNL